MRADTGRKLQSPSAPLQPCHRLCSTLDAPLWHCYHVLTPPPPSWACIYFMSSLTLLRLFRQHSGWRGYITLKAGGIRLVWLLWLRADVVIAEVWQFTWMLWWNKTANLSCHGLLFVLEASTANCEALFTNLLFCRLHVCKSVATYRHRKFRNTRKFH